MATKFLDPGGDADFGFGLWSDPNQGAAASPPTIVTDFVVPGHLKSTNPNGGFNGQKAVCSDAGTRISFWINVRTNPGATDTIVVINQTGFGATPWRMRLTTAGVIQLTNGTVQIGSNGQTLSAGWHRLSFAYTITSTTVNEFRTWVDGVADISITNATLTTTGSSDILIGNASGDGTISMRLSDFYIDNSSSLTDPGGILVTAKRPFANGTANDYTVNGSAGAYGSGNARYTNERPINTTNTVSVTPTTVKTEEYSIEAKSVGDIDISSATIIDFMGWMSAKVASTANTPVMKIIVAGVSTTKTLTTTNAIYTQIAGSSTYPAGNTDIGMSAQYTTTGHLVTLNECGVVVAYIPFTTTDKTLTGVARITATTLKTLSGVARVTATTVRTITGVARVTRTTLQTISGKGRITAQTLQTLPGKARLTAQSNQTSQGKARITNTSMQTVSGISRMLVASVQTLIGKARVTNASNQTIPGKARVTVTTTKPVTGVSRIGLVTLKTLVGLGRITILTTQTVTGKARVTLTLLRTITGVARIQTIVNKVLSGVARITIKTQRTITGVARVTTTTLRTIPAVGRIMQIVRQTLPGKARIQTQTNQPVVAKSSILVTDLKTIPGQARVTQITPQVLSGRSRLTTAVSQTLTGLARVLNHFDVNSQTITGKAYICIEDWEDPNRPGWQKPSPQSWSQGASTGWQSDNTQSWQTDNSPQGFLSC